jgi:hypothetical protein
MPGSRQALSKKRKTSLIVTHMNQKLHPDGHSEEFLTEVDGVKLTSANYVVGKTINSPLLTHKIARSLSLIRIFVLLLLTHIFARI